MAIYTTNLNLEKPAGNENFKRQVFNDNMDKLDAAVAARETITGSQAKVEAVQASVDAQPEIDIRGMSYVNLLGRDGNCEDVSKFTGGGGSLALYSANKVFGANSIKVTSSISSGYVYVMQEISSLISTSKYYFMTAYCMNGTATNIYPTFMASQDWVNPAASVTSNSDFTRVGIKIQPSDMSSSTSFYAGIVMNISAIGQYSYFDGIMVNEITQGEYNTLTVEQLLAKYPYVDSYATLQNPYFENRRYNLVRNGNGEEGIGYWIPNSAFPPAVTVLSTGGFRLSYSTGTWIKQVVDVKANTNYYIKAVIGPNAAISIFDTTITTALKSGTGSFNTGTHSQVAVLLQIAASGTADISNVHIIEGTTAPTEYKSCDFYNFIIEGQFTNDDTIKIKDGKISGILWWKHKTLYGKDYNWQYWSDNTGNKNLYLVNADTGFGNMGNPLINNITKYNGMSLVNYSATGVPTVADYFYNNATSAGSVIVAASDTDTGFAESIIPNASEIKAFMNGWKAVMNNGSRYICFASVVDAVLPTAAYYQTTTIASSSGQKVLTVPDGTKYTAGQYILAIGAGTYTTYVADTIASISGNSLTMTSNIPSAVPVGTNIVIADNGSTNISMLTWCMNNIAHNYEGYRLHYKLANPEPITDASVHVHGDIWSIVSGDNYIMVDSGIVLSEVANPIVSASYYVYNVGLAGYEASRFKNKAEVLYTIYKNNVYDLYNWTPYNDGNSYGKVDGQIPITNFDTTATYTVDYQILKTLHAQSFSSLTMQYAQDVFSAINGVSRALEEKQHKDSVLDTLIDLSEYEKKYTYSSACFITYGYVFINFSLELTPKKCKPAIISEVNIASYGTDYTKYFQLSNISIFGNMVKGQYYSTNSSVIAAIQSYGANAYFGVTADCRGRI